MYARGAGSNLILDSPISNIGILELAAEEFDSAYQSRHNERRRIRCDGRKQPDAAN